MVLSAATILLAAPLLAPPRRPARPQLLPVAGRWYREAEGRDETLQLEAKGAVVYTRASGKSLVKSYGTWRRSGTSALIVKLPIKDLRRNDEKGFILRVESGRLVPRDGEAWVRARRPAATMAVPIEGRYTALVRRSGNNDLLTLELTAGGAATLVRSPRGGTSEESVGRWETRGGEIVLIFEEIAETRLVREGASLQARAQDSRTFGEAPIRFLRSPRS